MGAISSLGIGSGLDISGLVSGLVSAEGASKTARLDRREIDYQARLSLIGSIKSALTDFQDTYSSLKLSSTFKSYTASSSDSAAFTATAKNGAEETSYSLTVTQIAKANKFKTIEFADKSTSIGTGTLTFTQNTVPPTNTTVTIADGSLEGIRDAINDADFGVEASIIFNGTGYVLSMATDTGTESAISDVVVSTTSGDLSDFAKANLIDIQTAQDAKFSLNGVDITSQTNTISNIIDNVTLELKAGDGGIATETLTIGRDTSSVEEAVQSFVDGYNSLITGINSATYYDSESEESGVLIGDPTVRGIVTQLRNMLNTTVGDSTVEFNSFASIGILTARDGTLEFDSSKLSSALQSKPDEIQALFAGGMASTPSLDTSIVSVTDNIGAGTYLVDITSVPERGIHAGTEFTPGSFDFSGETSGTTGSLAFNVTIDGVSSADIFLPPADYTLSSVLLSGQSVAAALQKAINDDASTNNRGYSTTVTFEESATTPGDYSYKIASNKYGLSSSVELTPIGGSLAALLNIGNAGNPAVGANGAGTIAGEAATFDGNRMTGTGLYSGFVLDITGGSTGIRSINVSEGNIGRIDSLLNSLLDSDGSLQAKTDGLNASIATVNQQREDLAARLDDLEARLIKKFSAMDGLVAQLNSTGSYLATQLEQVANIGRK